MSHNSGLFSSVIASHGGGSRGRKGGGGGGGGHYTFCDCPRVAFGNPHFFPPLFPPPSIPKFGSSPPSERAATALNATSRLIYCSTAGTPAGARRGVARLPALIFFLPPHACARAPKNGPCCRNNVGGEKKDIKIS